MAVETNGDRVAHTSVLRAIECSLIKSLFWRHFVKQKIKSHLALKEHDCVSVMN